jgi:hypothetical protein
MPVFKRIARILLHRKVFDKFPTNKLFIEDTVEFVEKMLPALTFTRNPLSKDLSSSLIYHKLEPALRTGNETDTFGSGQIMLDLK